MGLPEGGKWWPYKFPSFHLNEEFVRVRELIYSTRGDLKRGGVVSDGFCPLVGTSWKT